MLEDSHWDAELIKKEIRNFGFEISTVIANEEKSFVKSIHEFQPDLILSDYSLPQFDGFRAISLAKELVPDTPIIIVTGTLSEELAADSIKRGAWDYVVKQRLFRLESAINNSLKLSQEQSLKRQAEQDLQESMNKLKMMIDYSPIGVVSCNRKGEIITANQMFCEMLGYPQAELLQKTIFEITYQADLPLTKQKHKSLFQQEEVYHDLEKRYLTKQGEIIFAFIRSHLVLDNQKKPLFMVSIVENISQRKQAKKALTISQKKMKTIYENSLDVIIVLDYQSGKIIDINRAAKTYLGYQPTELLGKYFTSLFPPDEKKERLVSIDNLKIHGGIIESQQYLHKSGEIVMMDITVTEIPWNSNEALLINLRDASERHQNQLRLSHELREKEVMLMEIHHRVKNNMQIMASILKMQANDSPDAAVKQALLAAQSRIYSMSLVHEAIYGDDNMDLINFSKYAQKVIQFVRHSNQDKLESIKFEYEIEAVELNLETAVPVGQIIAEIVSNSMQHAFPAGEKGLITISVNKLADRYQIILSDNGISLPAEDELQKISKMGLLLVNILCQQLKAEVNIERAGGTKFTIVFSENNTNNKSKNYRYFPTK